MKYINLRLLLALSATVVVFTLSGCNNSAEDEFYKQFSAEQVQELKQTKAKITAAKEEQNSIKGRLDTAKDELSMTIQQYTGMRSEIDYYNDLFNNVQMLESKRDSLIQEITSIEPSVYNGAFISHFFKLTNGTMTRSIDKHARMLCYEVLGIECIELDKLDKNAVTYILNTDNFMPPTISHMQETSIMRVIDHDMKVVIYLSEHNHSPGFKIRPFSSFPPEVQKNW